MVGFLIMCVCVCVYIILTLPTTPRPRTVSRVPDRLKILQCLSLSWTTSLPMFSRRIQYRHYRKNTHRHVQTSLLTHASMNDKLVFASGISFHPDSSCRTLHKDKICCSPSKHGNSGPPEKTRKFPSVSQKAHKHSWHNVADTKWHQRGFTLVRLWLQKPTGLCWSMHVESAH